MPTIGHFYLFSLTDRSPASRAGEIKWVLCYDWLPERTGRAYFACTGSPDLSPGKTLILFSLFNKLVRSRWREWNRSCLKTLEKRNRLTGISILFPQVSRMDSAASSLIGWKALCCRQVERDNETKAKIPHVSVDWSVDVQQWSKGNSKESAFKERGLEVTRCSLTTLRKFWLHISRYSLHCYIRFSD